MGILASVFRISTSASQRRALAKHRTTSRSVECLAELLQKVRYTDCSGRDRYVFDVLRDQFCGRHLLEIDRAADPLACNPRGLLLRLEEIDDQYWEASRNPTKTADFPL